MSANTSSLQEHYRKRLESLRTERSDWQPTWEAINRVLLPRTGRFLVTDRNRGERKDNNIYDSTATRALRILAAGMMAGMTSPARPWFRLTTPDPDLAESYEAKAWLSDVTMLLRRIFSRSNTYRSLHQLYREVGAYGTCASFMLDNFDTVTHFHTMTIGEYFIGTNEWGRADTIYREFDMTVGQLVAKFGLDNVSRSTRDLYNRGDYDKWVTVVHMVEPRTDRVITSPFMRDAPFVSAYIEKGDQTASGGARGGARTDVVLQETGYREFPGVVARWDAVGGDIYGSGPGHDTLGDINQLQHEQLSKGRGIEQQTNPSVMLPTSLKGHEDALLPGGTMFYDQATPHGGVRRSYDIQYDLNHLLVDIQDVRDRIMSNFFADLFQMIALSDRRQVTATEIAERHEEKLLMLGPVLENLHNELLDPVIDRTFAQALRAGLIPEPPEEIQGQELKVEYVSMLAQAQQAVGVNAFDRLLGTVAGVAQIKPDVIDKIDFDGAIDQYADMLGVDPELIVPGEKVALIRQQRQQQEAAAQAAAMAPPMAQAAKNLSETNVEDTNALTSMFSGI